MKRAVAQRGHLPARPRLREVVLQGSGKARERGAIFGAPAQASVCSRRSRAHGTAVDIEAGLRQVGQDRFGRRQRIEPHRMRHLVRTAGIGREHQRQLREGAGVAASRCQPAMRDRRRPSRARSSARCAKRELQIRIALGRRFEAGDAGEIRPSISGSTTCMARSAADNPRSDAAHLAPARGRQRDLEHRTTRRIERRGTVIAARGERGRVDDGGRSQLRKYFAEPFGGAGRLQRGHEQADRVEPLARSASINASTGPVSAAVR